MKSKGPVENRASKPRRESSAAAEAPVAGVAGLSRAVLSDGLTVYALRREGVPLLGVRLLFPRGSAACPKGQSGLAELTAQLLRRGTQALSAAEIDARFEGVGSDLGVGVGDDSTRFSLSCEPRSAAGLLALLGQLLTTPTFPKAEVAALRRRTGDQLKGALDDAEWVATRAAYRAAFDDHPYGNPSEGWSREVAGLGRKDARNFAEGYLGRGAVLVLSGAVGESLSPLLRALGPLRSASVEAPPAASTSRARPIAASAAASLPGALRSEPRAEPRAEPDAAAGSLAAPAPLRGRGVLLVDKPDATQAQLRLVGSGVRRAAPELIPLILGNGVLGDGFSSRLVNEVRVNRGLTYGISSRFGALAAGGLFAVRSFTRLDKVAELIQVVLDQVAKLRDEGASAAELRRVRTYLGGSFRLATETADQVGAQLAEAFRYRLGEDWLVRYPQLLEETSGAEVAAALASHLPVENFRVVAVGPAKQLAPQLRQFGSVEVVKLSAWA